MGSIIEGEGRSPFPLSLFLFKEKFPDQKDRRYYDPLNLLAKRYQKSKLCIIPKGVLITLQSIPVLIIWCLQPRSNIMQPLLQI